MKTTHFSPLLLLALVVSMSGALADSTDEALNQFYTDNMATRLSSEGPGDVITNPPPQKQKAEKELIRAKRTLW